MIPDNQEIPGVHNFCMFRVLGTDKPCIDERTDCKETLTQNPDVCQKFPAFASRYCRLSCGVCSGDCQVYQLCLLRISRLTTCYNFYVL